MPDAWVQNAKRSMRSPDEGGNKALVVVGSKPKILVLRVLQNINPIASKLTLLSLN